METNSILNIKNIKEDVWVNLDNYRKQLLSENADMKVSSYGHESEYSLNGIIEGIKSILTDISYLTKSHNIFLQLSTYEERLEILTNLNNINSYISNSNHQKICVVLDTLKSRLRNYNLRYDKERLVEFTREIDELRKLSLSLDDEIKKVRENQNKSEEAYNDIEKTKQKYSDLITEIFEKKDELSNNITQLEVDTENLLTIANRAENNEKIISEKFELVKEMESKINSFVELIDKRDIQLTQQEKTTADYINTLKSYTSANNEKNVEVNQLIENAKRALQYSTAQGISAAFQTQFDNANSTGNKKYWLWGAAIFIFITILLGVWVVGGWFLPKDNHLYNIIGRLSMMPFTLLGALFCANQYIKQKNIIEDYAYKVVLSKSIVAFSEELRDKDKERYAEYISTVLKEIHQDPLRRRGKEKDEVTIKDSSTLVEKIIELVKMTTK